MASDPDGITKLQRFCPERLAQPAPDRGYCENRPEDDSIANVLAIAEAAEQVELDLTPGKLQKDSDPVLVYFREMGAVSLLTRKGEVAIAKRIERGQVLVLKTVSRSPIVLKELLATGEELRQRTLSIKEIVRFDHDELTEEKIKNKTRHVLRIIDEIDKLYQVALKQAAKLGGRTPRANASARSKPRRCASCATPSAPTSSARFSNTSNCAPCAPFENSLKGVTL